MGVTSMHTWLQGKQKRFECRQGEASFEKRHVSFWSQLIPGLLGPSVPKSCPQVWALGLVNRVAVTSSTRSLSNGPTYPIWTRNWISDLMSTKLVRLAKGLAPKPKFTSFFSQFVEKFGFALKFLVKFLLTLTYSKDGRLIVSSMRLRPNSTLIVGLELENMVPKYSRSCLFWQNVVGPVWLLFILEVWSLIWNKLCHKKKKNANVLLNSMGWGYSIFSMK